MKKKIAILLVAALSCTGILSGCGQTTETGDANATADTSASTETGDGLTSVVMYGVPDPQISAAQVIAEVNGYYEEEGLDVTNKVVANSPEVGPILASNEAQIAFTSSYAAMTWVNSDVPVKILTPVCDMGGTQDTCIRGDITITKPQDLEGLNVGCCKGTESEIILHNMCDALGVDYSSLNIIPLQGPDMISALEKGDIDIMAAWEPWVTKAEGQLGAKFLMSGTKSEIPGSDPDSHWLSVYSTMVATDDYIKNNPETIAKIMRAIKKATDFINNNREEAVKILSKEFDIEETDLTRIMSRNDYTMGVTSDYLYWADWLAKYAKEKDVIQKDLAIDDFNNFEILKSELPELYNPDGAAE